MLEEDPSIDYESEIEEQSDDKTDSALIRDFVDNADKLAFETLVRRHYNTVHRRLLSIMRNNADADDLSQKLWLRVLEYLPKYQDKQKFAHFLNTIATNLVKDEWRKKSRQNQSSLDEIMEAQAKDSSGSIMLVDELDTADQMHNRSELSYLIKTLIPKLAIKLRAVFLLRHESEYWDGKQPFQWQHLAELNNIEIDEAYSRFISARDVLLTEANAAQELNDEDRLIFITWTQAQRLEKSSKQTETYLADLLGIPVNTFKTRYRAALAELSEGLTQWRNTQRS